MTALSSKARHRRWHRHSVSARGHEKPARDALTTTRLENNYDFLKISANSIPLLLM
ncbi:MAG TPA: hypothetical protein VF258_07460 [Luteolibacter sp.]